MIDFLPLSPKLIKKLQKYSLEIKFNKQLTYFLANPNHPSLGVELLEPKQFGIYSFRVDKKFRALFFFRPDKNAIEILNITVHYH